MKINTAILDRLSIPIKLSFPVINVSTFESSRAELVFQQLATYVGKTFIKMQFKEVPSPPTINKLLQEARATASKSASSEFKGLVIFDAYFSDRQRINSEVLPGLRSSLDLLEKEGVNYIIADKEKIHEEFVYHMDLPPLELEEFKSILSSSEMAVNPNGVFTDDERTTISNNARGLSFSQLKNLFTYCAYLKYKNEPYIDEILREKSHILRDVGLDIISPVDINLVGGLENIKSFLFERRAGWSKDLPVKGILLAGVPGGGKTLIAKAAAHVLGTSLVRLDISKFYSKYLGETERLFSRALQTIDQISPVTVLVDETEKMFGSADGDHETSRRLLGVFLFWLQERKSKVFIVATANRVAALPTEFMRAGRWDRSFFIDLPNDAEREMIFKIHLSKYADVDKFDLKRLVAASLSYTGAEIEQSITDALYIANAGDAAIDQAIVIDAISRITPTSETRRDDINRIRELRNQGFYPASIASEPVSENHNRTITI